MIHVLFDETDTLKDTNEAEYSLTQRLYRRHGDSQSNEMVSWRVAQKYYFDPSFGGALISGQRNVFQALNSITPFAFAEPSPLPAGCERLARHARRPVRCGITHRL